MKIYTKLAAIQAALKAPKSQFNKFGGYHYRKAEDILEAVKPLLLKEGCILNCTDELLLVGDRYYIKATAIITAVEDGSQIQTTAYAREEEEKKGMDGSQVTGASSSYARKYALNGLLCIDDTADSDTTNQGDGDKAAAKPAKPAGNRTKPAAGSAAPAQEEKSKKKPLPARGSEEWKKWANAVMTGWHQKSTGRSAIAVFADIFEADEETMQKALADLQEDAFDERLKTGPATEPANV